MNFIKRSWPRAIFVSSVFHSYKAVREALFLGLPCFGIVDTNTTTDYITIPFPGMMNLWIVWLFIMIVFQILF
jgi:ribosomal protein S2